MCFVQQIHTKIISIVDGSFAITHSEIIINARESIKSAIGFCKLKPFGLFHQLQSSLPSSVKFFHHFISGVQWRSKSSNCRPLCNGTGAAGKLSLQFFTGLCYFHWGSNKTQTPAGHGKTLTQSVYNNSPLLHSFKL